MRKLLVFAALAWLAWYGYTNRPVASATQAISQPQPIAPLLEQPRQPRFTCDGRVHCSQMTSCAEATYFVKNCPGTKMDGNNDGVPCESQWCG
jgi:hypothetical protein